MNTVPLDKKLRTSNGVRAGALPWCNNHDLTPGDRQSQEFDCITKCRITWHTLNKDLFFSIENRQAHQNTSNLCICQKKN